jgi:hypothetical protein
MPREVYLVTPTPVTLEALVRAAAEVDEQLALVALYGGQVLQLLDQADDAVLSIGSSRLLADSFDAGWIAPQLRLPSGPVWWTEASAPWGAAGQPGVVIAERLAARLAGVVQVEDGR